MCQLNRIETFFFCYRPKKRRAKKRYSTLDFSDDKSYFQKACSHEIWYPKTKRNYNYSRKRKKTEKNESPKNELASYLSFSDTDEKPFKNFNPFLNEMGLFRIKEEVDPSSSTLLSQVKTEPRDDRPKSISVWKIRIKSAYELGSNILFVDISNESGTGPKPPPYQPVFSDLITNEAEAKLTKSTNFMTKFNIPVISSLYKEFFTNDNRMIIKKVAEVLQNLSENIKKKNDKLTEINCSRSTDAEKLMLRHQAHGEFNRVRDANQIVLKQQFEVIGESFNHENFEILFLLFFLGILKTFIVSVSNKKGTLFKKIVSLLSQSLSSCEYQNERILNLLKSKDFRADCLALVHFLEKYSETKFFDMLVISDADKKQLLSAKNLGDRVDVSESASKPSLLSTNAKIPSIVKYSKGMKILPVGSNLLLQSSNSSSTIQSKVEPMTELNKKKSKITSALINSMNAVKYAPVNQIASKISSTKKPLPPPNFIPVTSLSLSAPNYKVSRTKSTAAPSIGPPPYSVGISAGTISFSAVNAVSNSAPNSSASIQSMSRLLNSNSNTQPSGGFTHFSSCAQPMCTYSTSTSFANSSSIAQSGTTFMNSSSNILPIRNFTNSNPGIQSIIPSNCGQSMPQLTLPVSSTTIPTSSYPYVIHSSLPPVVPSKYTPNVVLTASHSSNRSHSVIVTPGSSVVSVSHAMGPPPPYTVTSIGVTARGIVQPSPPLPQLLPPVVPPLLPQSDTVPTCGIMQSSSPLPQLLPPALSNLHSPSAEDIGRGILQPLSPLAQLQPLSVHMLPQTPIEPSTTRGIMQSSPPLPELLPPAVPNLQAQPINHAFINTITSDASAQNCNEMSLSATDAASRREFVLRTYGSAREVNKRVQIPSLCDQNGLTSKSHQPGSADNPALSIASAGSPHHSIASGSCADGGASITVASSQANGPFSPYRTISPAGNSENIQPHSPHSLLHQNVGDSGSRLVKDPSYSICPTTSSNDGLTLRSLLIDNGRAPLVNQNGPIEAPFQYAEKSNFSLDLPPVLSPDAITNDTLVTNHLPMANYVGSPYSC